MVYELLTVTRYRQHEARALFTFQKELQPFHPLIEIPSEKILMHHWPKSQDNESDNQ